MAAFEAGNPMGANVDLDDILAQMFGMHGMNGSGGRGPGPRRPQKGRDEEQSYTITLEESFKGKTTKFASKKNVICKGCKGSGGRDKAKPKDCGSCHGRGIVCKYVKISRSNGGDRDAARTQDCRARPRHPRNRGLQLLQRHR